MLYVVCERHIFRNVYQITFEFYSGVTVICICLKNVYAPIETMTDGSYLNNNHHYSA